MQDYQFGLISEASLRTTPQDSLKNCESDYSSIFGDAKLDFSKDIPLQAWDENEATPFSYETTITSLFGSYDDSGSDYYDFEDAPSSTLGFEC